MKKREKLAQEIIALQQKKNELIAKGAKEEEVAETVSRIDNLDSTIEYQSDKIAKAQKVYIYIYIDI